MTDDSAQSPVVNSTGGKPPRRCFYIPVEQFDENGYIPSLVTEDEPGHSPLTGQGQCGAPWYWGRTYDEAVAVCAAENAKLGLSEADALAIVASSMFPRTRPGTQHGLREIL